MLKKQLEHGKNVLLAGSDSKRSSDAPYGIIYVAAEMTAWPEKEEQDCAESDELETAKEIVEQGTYNSVEMFSVKSALIVQYF